jgi:sulfide:quinone oxidoreductase
VPRLTRPRHAQLGEGVRLVRAEVDHVDLPARRVHLAAPASGPPAPATLDYDVLVVATGAVLTPEETDGLELPDPGGRVHTFYSPEGAAALARALEGFQGGRLVVDVVDMPVKCPVAPLEFCFLADSYFRHRGLRDRVELVYATPLDGAFTTPVASRTLGELLDEKGIHVVTEFNLGTVDGPGGRLVAYDGREERFDLAVVVPLHSGPAYVGRSPGLGDELGFVPVDRHTNCFVETGGGKALLIDFNYDTEPLPGHYPAPIGLPLLRESRLNHAGKLLFQPLYWHVLLPGRDLPGIGSTMPRSGKQVPPPTAAAPAGPLPTTH